jgi:hypothetical protein
MAEKVRFIVTDVLKSGTVTASAATAGLPVTNVQDDLVRKVYRSTTASNEWIKFDMGSATTINALGIINHNITLGSVVKWQGNASDSWASPSLNTNLTVATDSLGANVLKIGHYYVTNQSYRWWRLYVEPGTGNASPVDIGRIMAGRYIEPSRNIRDGFSITVKDPSRGMPTVGRQAYWTTRRSFSELNYNVARVDEQQADEFTALYNQVGLHTPFIISLDPTTRPSHNTFYVQFMGSVGRTQQILRDYNIDSVRLEEKI